MEELKEEELLHFLCAEGGKAKNSDLLTRYRSLINHVDAQLRAHHRQTFKEIINKVALVKQEDGEKYVILKKRYLPLLAVPASAGEPEDSGQPPMAARGPQPHSGLVQWEGARPSVPVPCGVAERTSPKEKLRSSIPHIQVKDFSTQLGAQKTACHSAGWTRTEERPASSPKTPEDGDEEGLSAGTQEEEADEIPKETEQDVFEDGGSSEGSASMTLDPVEKEWLQGAASGNFQTLSQLLKQEPSLALKKDFTSGFFTALHWAAKHGKSEMVTMLVNAGADINIRAHGGYTPLHIAALHGHRQIMSLLTSNYGAKESVRDYSGHFPAHYLKPEGARDGATDNHQFQQVRGERRNRKLASLFLAKSSGHSKKRWGSAEDLVEEDEEEEKGNMLHLALPTAYRPVRKFSR